MVEQNIKSSRSSEADERTSVAGLSLLVEEAAGAVEAGDDHDDNEGHSHAEHHAQDQRQSVGGELSTYIFTHNSSNIHIQFVKTE